VIACCVFGGCATTAQRNLETFVIPEQPAIAPVASGTDFILSENHFIDLTKYILELQSTLEQCNAQAEVFNGER
jgi:hypothetical protein